MLRTESRPIFRTILCDLSQSNLIRQIRAYLELTLEVSDFHLKVTLQWCFLCIVYELLLLKCPVWVCRKSLAAATRFEFHCLLCLLCLMVALLLVAPYTSCLTESLLGAVVRVLVFWALLVNMRLCVGEMLSSASPILVCTNLCTLRSHWILLWISVICFYDYLTSVKFENVAVMIIWRLVSAQCRSLFASCRCAKFWH